MRSYQKNGYPILNRRGSEIGEKDWIGCFEIFHRIIIGTKLGFRSWWFPLKPECLFVCRVVCLFICYGSAAYCLTLGKYFSHTDARVKQLKTSNGNVEIFDRYDGTIVSSSGMMIIIIVTSSSQTGNWNSCRTDMKGSIPTPTIWSLVSSMPLPVWHQTAVVYNSGGANSDITMVNVMSQHQCNQLPMGTPFVWVEFVKCSISLSRLWNAAAFIRIDRQIVVLDKRKKLLFVLPCIQVIVVHRGTLCLHASASGNMFHCRKAYWIILEFLKKKLI